MDKREFIACIRACRQRMNLAETLKILVFALCIGAGAGIVFQAAAFVLPVYYANLYTGLALLLAILAAIVAAYAGRKSMAQAALLMDSFGFQERIITAFEHLEENSGIVILQREDAMRQLRAEKERIKIPVWPSGKKLLLCAGMFAVLLGLAFAPSPSKERAKELHQLQREAREKEKEIKETVEELEQLLAQEELTPEQLAALQEMIESLQSSAMEYQQANSAEALAAANEKLDYKYENMGSQLSTLAQSLQDGAKVSPATAQSMQAMADKMQEKSGNTGNGQLASNQGQNNGQNNGQPGNGQNNGQNNGQSGNGQNSGQNNSQSGNGQNGGDQNGQNRQDGQNGGNQNGQSQSGGQGGQNSGNQNGQSQSGGQGGNPGDGDQGNSAVGHGSGGDSGGGRGTGSSNSLHDYVSIPNAIADSGNLSGSNVDHDSAQYFRTQNGLSWEGTHMSHEAVIGKYEQNAYEGIAAGRYPSGMENVIKEYFASFN